MRFTDPTPTAATLASTSSSLVLLQAGNIRLRKRLDQARWEIRARIDQEADLRASLEQTGAELERVRQELAVLRSADAEPPTHIPGRPGRCGGPDLDGDR
ncbi:hypothetical protein ACIBF1_44225 [Spirillospora sp. NPDC050679]